MKDIGISLRGVGMTFEGQAGGDEGLISWAVRRFRKERTAPQRYRVEAL